MPTPGSFKCDVSRVFPLGPEFINNPYPGLCYHRFYDDSDTLHEIFVPPGREKEILDLDKQGNWSSLLKFPPFSDQPPPSHMRATCLALPQPDGTMKQFYVPDEDASQARMTELVIAEDYKTLEREFVPWNNQPHPIEEKVKQWERGVERCARARALDEKARQQTEGK